MFYVYVLKMTRGGQLYIGFTKDLKRRLQEHLLLKSKYTKSRGPQGLIYYEAYASEKDARIREQKLKQFKGSYSNLKKRINNSLNI